MLDQRNMSVFVLIVSSFEGFSDCQNNIPICTTVQKALNDMFIQHSVGLFWVPGHYGVHGNEIADGLAREGTVHQFVGLDLALGVSRHNVRKKIKGCIDGWYMAMWQCPIRTQRQAQKLISGPNPTAKTRPLSFNRIQSRVGTGLRTGYNTLV
jgi:hypothetical protein